MNLTKEKKEHSSTSVPPSTSIRLGRQWVDYAEANSMPMRGRVSTTKRYVWLEQTPHQWYSAMLYIHWYIVGQSTGWNTQCSAETTRLVNAARHAYRQLVIQSPKEWHDWLKDKYMGHELVSAHESFITWHIKLSQNRPSDLDSIICPYLPILTDTKEVLLQGLSMKELSYLYDPIRDPTRDNCWGVAWRFWCVDHEESGWMVEYTARVVPFITLLHHRQETVCHKPGCSLCGAS